MLTVVQRSGGTTRSDVAARQLAAVSGGPDLLWIDADRPRVTAAAARRPAFRTRGWL